MRTRKQEREIKQIPFPKNTKLEPKILNLAVHIEKLTAKLNDGRELTKNKPAHIHIETSRGEIEFWLEKTDEKSKDEVKVKKIKGQVSEREQNETETIVKKNKDLFLKEWNRRNI